MNAVFDLPDLHAQVLSLLIEKIPPAELTWALTGSAGLRLQGVDIPVQDLDLQTDARTIYALEKKLAEFVKVPVHIWESDHTHSYHGQAEINGLQVEFLGGMSHRSPAGIWEPAVDVMSVCVWINWRGSQVRALSLQHEAQAYEKMGRIRKAELIRSAIRKEIL